MTASALVGFGLCLALGYAVQTAIGFGAMVVATTLGALFLPLEAIAPTVMPISLLQTSAVLWRDHPAVDRDLLLRQVLPWMGVGVPVGAWAAGWLPVAGLRAALGVTVLFLLVRDVVGLPAPARVSRWGLVGAGVSEGMLGTGGPLLVWSLGRTPLAPRPLRTTMTAVWWVTEIAVIALWTAQGRLTGQTAAASLVLLPTVPVGLFVGERALRRLDPATFRRAVTWALAVAAAALVLRG